MSKRITDLNEALANRPRRDSQDTDSEPSRPRLADRLVDLAPLARPPLTSELDPGPPEDPKLGLSTLAGVQRPAARTALPRAPAPVPPMPGTSLVLHRSALPAVAGSTAIATPRPAANSPPPAPTADEGASNLRALIAFLVGLAIAAVAGIVAYAELIWRTPG